MFLPMTETWKTLRPALPTIVGCAVLAGLLTMTCREALARGELLLLQGDTIGGRTILYLDHPGLNSVGDVIFNGQWAENGQRHADIMDLTGAVIVANHSDAAAINDAGRIVFPTGYYEDFVYKLALFDQDGMRIVGADDTVAGRMLSGATRPAINNNGIIAFEGRDVSFKWGIYDTTGVLHAAVGEPFAGGTLSSAYWVSINDADQVAFWASVRFADGQFQGGLFRSDGTLLVTAGDEFAGKTFEYLLGRPALTNSGEAVFSAGYTQGGSSREAILRSDGSVLVDDGDVIAGKHLTGFRDLATNSLGDVAFMAAYFENGSWNYGIFFLGADELEPTPAELIARLISDVDEINARNGIQNSRDAKLDAAFDALTAENGDEREDAVHKLEAFINSVEAQRDKDISTDEADLLIGEAERIIQQLQ